MKKTIFSILTAGVLLMSCAEKKSENPFFEEWNTPHGTAPFDKIKNEHYMPAFERGIKNHQAEIDAIVNNQEEPTFANTIEAMDAAGKDLSKVSSVFYNLKSANSNNVIDSLSKVLSPLLSAHNDGINMNEKLFTRVKKIYDKRIKDIDQKNDEIKLTGEQKKLLEDYYIGFVSGGAELNETDKTKLKGLNKELGLLALQFGENVLKDNNSFELVLEEKDLDGLPEGVRAAASDLAKSRGKEGKFVFTLDKPSLLPFLTYSKNRELREKMFKGYTNRGNNGGETDNNKILAKIASIRVKKANLLGYKTWADYKLANRMAKKPDNVYELLLKLWKPAIARAKAEVKDMQKIIRKEGGKFRLEPWDWWHYAEKVKKEKYALDEEMIRPYFVIDNVRDGAFWLAGQLYGIKFKERKDIQVYHEEVKAFEVMENDGSHIGILYVDYHPRPVKRGGAWMNSYRKQYKVNGKNVTPIITNVCNFSRPAGDKPALLSADEVETLFHEFGHALHGLLSNCTYITLSGTSVPRDFVELPSQVMENWCFEPEVLKQYAKHYKTGEIIPEELVKKINKAGHFNQGFANVEYLAASLLDMDYHTITDAKEVNAKEFEEDSMKKYGLIKEIVPRYRSTYFNHIFSSSDGYSSGYYSYIWAAVLDADAYQAFVESGNLFDKETAKKFRDFVISRGGTEDAMEMYKKFRGKKPTVDALLKKRGLN